MQTRVARHDDLVFINCPFDEDYMPLLRVILFTIFSCGFVPQCSLGEDDGSDSRLDKIMRCIDNCKYGIHDISRVELSENNLPRFNMPFELGIFFGAKRFGRGAHKMKNALIFERKKYQYQQYLSDLNGIDTKAHNNDPDIIIHKIRDWLSTASQRENIPGHKFLQAQYAQFKKNLPDIVAQMGLDFHDIPFNEYCDIVETGLRKLIALQAPHPKPSPHMAPA